MSPLRQAWRDFWFTPQPAWPLGVTRLVWLAAFTYRRWRRRSAAWADVSDVFLRPISFYRALSLRPLGARSLDVLDNAWRTTTVCAMFGFATPVTLTATAILETYLAGLRYNYGKVSHTDAATVLALWALAFSRCADAASLDALIRRRSVGPSGEYQWPMRVVQVVVCAAFFGAGLSKLRRSGWAWISSDKLARSVATFGPGRVHDAGPFIASRPALAKTIAAATVAIETGAPLIFVRRLRAATIVSQLGLLGAIKAIMGMDFRDLASLYLFWVPWTRIPELVSRTRRGVAARQV